MVSIISLLAQVLVLAGAFIIAWALIPVSQLIRCLPAGSLRNRWYVMQGLIGLFLVGYLGYGAAFWGKHTNLLDLIVPNIFFSALFSCG